MNVINWPMSRLLLSIGANEYARWITGLPLTDSTGGFKCFRREVLEAIDLEKVRSNGYAFQIEMSFRAWKKGFRLVEIPIVFTDRIEGQSKMNKRIVREAIWMVWWLRLQVADEAPVRGTVFYKMTGSGNDFVILDGRATQLESWPPETYSRRVCDRRRGAGADGLVILTPSTAEAVRMAYWNSDGSRAAMCGNAALCSGRLAAYLEMVPAGEFCLLTDAGPVRVRCRPSTEVAEINLPDLELLPNLPTASPRSGERWMAFLTVGYPHVVVRVEDIEDVDVLARGKALRFDPVFGPAGANVNFVAPAAAQTDFG